MGTKLAILLMLALTCGCASKRENAKMWANVWHMSEALERGAPPQNVCPTLKRLAEKGAAINGYVIDKSGDVSDKSRGASND